MKTKEQRRALAWKGYQEMRRRGFKFFPDTTGRAPHFTLMWEEGNPPPKDYLERAQRFADEYFEEIMQFLMRERFKDVSVEATHNIDIDIDDKYSEPQFSCYSAGWHEVCINCVNLKADATGWFCGKTKRPLSSERVFRKKKYCHHVCIRFAGDEREFFPPAPKVVWFKPFRKLEGES